MRNSKEKRGEYQYHLLVRVNEVRLRHHTLLGITNKTLFEADCKFVSLDTLTPYINSIRKIYKRGISITISKL